MVPLIVQLWVPDLRCTARALHRVRDTRLGRQGLVIIPRHTDLAGDVVVAGCKLHARASGLLTDGLSIELLPRGLVGGVGEAALGLELGAAALQLIVSNQDVGGA